MNIVEARDVWKIYNLGNVKVYALRGLNLAIKKHEFLAIMGPSGSGKSTATHLMGCLDTPTKGEIFLEGKNIAKMTESELAEARGKKIGFVFQFFNLIPSLTAIENITLPMSFQNTSAKQRKKRAIELLEKVGLQERINHRPSELSGGESQRVAIARSLANDPELILADEPTGNLDSKTGTEIIKLLKSLHKKDNKTIAVISHDKKIASHAQKIVHLRDGKIKK
tara:strand:+ start:7543 stop:8214 length:672 start_codon:yes stop_codon:yes gene_type:complete